MKIIIAAGENRGGGGKLVHLVTLESPKTFPKRDHLAGDEILVITTDTAPSRVTYSGLTRESVHALINALQAFLEV